MSPSRQLSIAHCFIIIGNLPLGLMMCWVLAIFATVVPGQGPQIFTLDPIGMVGLMMMSFFITLAMAGIATYWSWAITSMYPELHSTRATVLRIMTVLVLLAPFVLTYLFSQRWH